jgi:hypothetical protein
MATFGSLVNANPARCKDKIEKTINDKAAKSLVETVA